MTLVREFTHLYLKPDHTVRDAIVMESDPNSIVGSWSTNNATGDVHIYLDEQARKNMVHKLYDDGGRPYIDKKESNESLIAQALAQGDRDKAKELGMSEEDIDRWLAWIEERRKS